MMNRGVPTDFDIYKGWVSPEGLVLRSLLVTLKTQGAKSLT